EPFSGEVQRLVPLDFLEFALATFTGPQQRLLQPRRRIVLHDPRRALGAQHTLVDRVVTVAFDVVNLVALDMHIDAAATCAHVAGGFANLAPAVGCSICPADMVHTFPRLRATRLARSAR